MSWLSWSRTVEYSGILEIFLNGQLLAPLVSTYTCGMATTQDVRQYLAYWFQLGKQVRSGNSSQVLLPKTVIAGDRYSDDFERCWQTVQSNPSAYYLDGTQQSISELLSPKWDLVACVRCSMPVPIPSLGMPSPTCPCNDLPTWPNLELPLPRSPIDSQTKLGSIYDRLTEKHNLN